MLCSVWFKPWKLLQFWSEYDFSNFNLLAIEVNVLLLWIVLNSDDKNACFQFQPILLWFGTQALLYVVPEAWEQHLPNVFGRARLRTAAAGTSHRDVPYVRQQPPFKNRPRSLHLPALNEQDLELLMVYRSRLLTHNDWNKADLKWKHSCGVKSLWNTFSRTLFQPAPLCHTFAYNMAPSCSLDTLTQLQRPLVIRVNF